MKTRRALRGNGQGADPRTAAIERMVGEDAVERPPASGPVTKPILMSRKEPNHA
jgi:hypothetical protein